jgi:hypothetical protein
MARLRSSIGHGLRAVLTGLGSGAAAIAGGILAVFVSTGRALGAAGGAILTGLAAVIMAAARGAGALLRAVGAGLAATARGASAGGAAVVHGIAAVGRAGGRGALGLTRAIARASGAATGAVLSGSARALLAFASAVAAFARIFVKATGAVLRAAGHAASATGRGLASAVGAAGRGGAAAIAAVARGAAAFSFGAGRTAGRAARPASATASAASSAAGQGAATAGKGVGRAVTAAPRRLYFVASDIADRLPRPVFRPWYLAAALLVIVAVAGVPYAKALLSTVTARPEVGTIRVESARPDELVTIDGVPRGRVPVTASVPPGRHRIEVGTAGQMRAHEVDVAAGRETLLKAAGADLKPTGSIRVTTDPAGAEVLVDGMLHGTSPVTIENLAEGTHALLVRDKSGSVRQTVRVSADDVLETTVQIRPGWLVVFAPVKLEVLESGRPLGSTEGGRMLVSPGPHSIEVVSDALGFRETRQVDIRPGAVVAVTVQLPPATIEVVAPDEAEIHVDGQPVGQAPLGPLQVAVGTREILMRHPAFGERRQVVSVTYKSPVKVVFE